MELRDILGKASILTSKYRYKLGIDSYVRLSIPEIYGRGFLPDYDLLRKVAEEANIVVLYPHTAEKNVKQSLNVLASSLGRDKKVVAYEVSLELGGGGEEIARASIFIYQQFQPVIQFAAGLTVGVLGNFVYDVLKKIYNNNNNPIHKSQFTIQRRVRDVRYNYIFDNLNAEEAIAAGRLIPDDKTKIVRGIITNNEYYDVYLTYNVSKGRWVQVQIY